MRGWKRVGSSGRKRLVTVVVLCCALLVALWLQSLRARPHSVRSNRSTTLIDDASLGHGVVRDHIHGQDVYWEYPRDVQTQVKGTLVKGTLVKGTLVKGTLVKGTLVFMHGCNHGGGDLWPPSAKGCPLCLGLPEEVRLRRAALRHGLFLMGISSLDRTGKRCWGELKTDGGENVAKIIRDVLIRQGLVNSPLFLVGASSGGQMVLSMPRKLKDDFEILVNGVYAQIRGIPAEKESGIFYHGYPPTAFVHMPRDGYNEPMIQRNMETLRGLGTPVLNIEIHPRPLSVEFFTSRSPLIDANMSKHIIAALHNAGMLNDKNYLVSNPRGATNRWAGHVQPVVGNLSLVLDESHVGELLNVAWAKHELVGDHAERVLEWLSSLGGRGGGA